MKIPTTRRGANWIQFAELVLEHVEKYTVSQYGDEGTDPVTHYTPDQCMDAIKRYVNRYGRNARGEEEAARDLLKIAHYVSLVYEKTR